jgi:hypothetical protein
VDWFALIMGVGGVITGMGGAFAWWYKRDRDHAKSLDNVAAIAEAAAERAQQGALERERLETRMRERCSLIHNPLNAKLEEHSRMFSRLFEKIDEIKDSLNKYFSEHPRQGG